MNIKKAFTLVELLIVAMVIGILVAIMTLSGSQATTTAKASNILSDMRHIRDAARMYFWDNPDTSAPELKDLKNYIERFEAKETDIYENKIRENESGQWFLVATPDDERVREKIAKKVAKDEIFGAPDTKTPYDTANATMYMFIRGNEKN